MDNIEESQIPDTTILAVGQSVQPEKTGTIVALPAELLLIIFQFCYEDFQEEEKDEVQLSDPPWDLISGGVCRPFLRLASPTELFDRFRSPSRFPFALAAVSTFWADLLLLQPQYWTPFIFFTGPVSITPCLQVAQVCRRLESYPQGIPIDIVVLSASPSEIHGLGPRISDDAVQEQLQIDIIAKHLQDRLPQCRSLFVESCAGVSFPGIGQWNYPNSESRSILSSVLFTWRECFNKERQCKPTVVTPYNKDDSRLSEYENLKSLAIVGSHLPGFLGAFHNENVYYMLERLVITDYKFSEGGLFLEDLLDVICNLAQLDFFKLQNVEFGDNSNLQQARSFNCHVSYLHLASISPSMMNKLSKQWNVSVGWTAHMSKCIFQPSLCNTHMLILDDPDVKNLNSLLRHWNGSALWIGRYRGSSINPFLNMLAKTYSSGSTKAFGCPRVETLYLFQTPNLSLKTLKRLIRKRNRRIYQGPAEQQWTSRGPVINRLSIDQCGLAPLTKADMDWFSSRSVNLTYLK